MVQNNVLGRFDTLPPEAQQQVIGFVAFLQTRYRPVPNRRAKPKVRLADETFIGIWSNREDMRDSGAWVRNSRSTEWGKLA
ncbi:MAG: DUF2281 domain-containing protein [Chloroflexota bacterium]